MNSTMFPAPNFPPKNTFYVENNRYRDGARYDGPFLNEKPHGGLYNPNNPNNPMVTL